MSPWPKPSHSSAANQPGHNVDIEEQRISPLSTSSTETTEALQQGSTPQDDSTTPSPSLHTSSFSPSEEPVEFSLKQDGKWHLSPRRRFQHDLYIAVGFLEFANAGDFAANVWNTIPVPKFAMVLMAVGGTFALIMSIFSLLDARRAWGNIQFLREERRSLIEEQKRRRESEESTNQVDVLLDVNYRELGTEVINRYGMDLLLGFGAIMIAAGSYLAIAGANPRVYRASNLLSGYIGNAPVTFGGLVNAMWNAYIWTKTSKHVVAAERALEGTYAHELIRRRARNVQIYCIVNGSATIIGGVASMVTAKHWQAYVPLIPVIISAIFSNAWWRKKVGYERTTIAGARYWDPETLTLRMEELEKRQKQLAREPRGVFPLKTTGDTTVLELLDLIHNTGVSERFYLRLNQDKRIRYKLFNDSSDSLARLYREDVERLSEGLEAIVTVEAWESIQVDGPERLQHQWWFIAEVLGTYYWYQSVASGTSKAGQGEKDSSQEKDTRGSGSDQTEGQSNQNEATGKGEKKPL